MFNNIPASTKKNDSTKPAATEKSKGGLSCFFTKSSSKSLSNGSSDIMKSKEDTVVKSELSIKSEINDDDLNNLMKVDFDEETETLKTELKKENEVKSSKGKKNKSKKRTRDVSEEKTNKKRKRIIERNDSESDGKYSGRKEGDF